MKVVLALSFVIINVASDSVSEDAIDLCSNTSNYENYTKNDTKNCGCGKTRACVRKCCQKGFYLQHVEDVYENVYQSVCVKNNDSDSFTVPIYKRREYAFNMTLDDNYLVGMLDCKNEEWQYFKMNNSDIRERFYIQENGSLYYPHSRYKYYDNSRYCIDEQDGLTAFLCYSPQHPSKSMSRLINSIGMIISMPFLLLTFLVFVLVPNASIHRKALMFYSLSLLLAYVFLVTVQLNNKYIEPLPCHTIGYSIIFFFMTSFFWMNVMCFDTWFAFGGLANFSREPKSEKKRFIIYFIYAWGLPLVHVFLVFVLNTFGDPESPFYPGVGKGKCFLQDGLRATFVYFYGPITVIIGLNIILFILTAIKIQKIKRDRLSIRRWTTKRRSYEYDKHKFNLYLKLLLAMGINWSLEIVSWAVELRQEERDPNSNVFFIWYISDFFNAIYGLIIFLIFIYRKHVWKSFKKRLTVLVTCCKNDSYEVEELGKSQGDIGSTTSETADGDNIYF